MSFLSSQSQSTLNFIPRDQRPQTYFHLIERVGPHGKYQKSLLYILGFLWLIMGNVFNGLPYLFRQYQFDCQAHGLAINDYQCQRYVCALGEQLWSGFIEPIDQEFKSIMTGGNYLCKNDQFVYLAHVSPFIGSVIGLLIFSMFSDNFGRKKAITISWLVFIIGSTVTAASVHLYMTTVGLFLCGLGGFPASITCFSFFCEVVSNRYRQTYSTVIQLFFPLGGLLSTIFCQFINEWRFTWIILVAIPSLLVFFMVLFYVQQTRKFLLRHKMQKSQILQTEQVRSTTKEDRLLNSRISNKQKPVKRPLSLWISTCSQLICLDFRAQDGCSCHYDGQFLQCIAVPWSSGHHQLSD